MHQTASRSEAHESLSLLFARDSIPPACICDSTEEIIQGKFCQKLKDAMCIAGSPDINHSKISSFISVLDYSRVYSGDLLVFTNVSFEDHLEEIELAELLQAALRVKAMKNTFSMDTIQCHGYLLTHEGLKPLLPKINAILAL